jgi:hypothetical protein
MHTFDPEQGASRKLGCAWLVLLLLGPPAFGTEPCPRNPCADSLEKCFEAVDWVLEGTIVDVRNGQREVCHTLPGAPGPFCLKIWDGGVVQFRFKRALKAKMPEGITELTLSASTQCWEQTSRISEDLIGKDVRIFGFNPGNGLAPRGIVNVAALPIGATQSDK